MTIAAELLDTTRVRCGAVELRSRTPMFALARRLLADGADPAALLTVRWASTGTVSLVEPLRKLAGLDVVETAAGERRFCRWKPDIRFPSAPCAATGQSSPEPVSLHPSPAHAVQRAPLTADAA